MAVVRGRSAPPYATIIFVFLWVISTGLAIWFAVEKGKSDKIAADATSKLKTNQTAGSASDKQMTNLKQVIEPAAQKNPDEVVGDATEALKAVGKSSSTLVAALTDLNNQVQQLNKTVGELQAQKSELEGKLAQGTQSNSAALASSQQALNSEKDAHAKASAEAARERADKEALLTAKEADLTKTRDEAEKTRRDLILQIEGLKNDIVAKEGTIASLRGQLQGMRKTGTNLATEAAGTVIRGRPGTEECYISLGRKDRVMPGMTFSIHDPRIGVKLQADTDPNAKPDPEAGGKGGLEVTEVGENESLCRVTFMKKGQHLEQGDLIANPVYQRDRNKKQRFVVYGEFDLDGDGVATASERDRLVRMIGSWGGIVEDNLSPETDYLVLGSRPSAASHVQQSSETPGGIADERAKMQKQYDDLFSEAKRSSVPILNGNRFMAMIGYYNATVVH
jgi:hypothetical protein